MELNRVDYALLKVLLKNDSVSFFKGMTIYEILDILGGSRVTTYKKLNRLVKLGYVEKGCKDINADTYLLTAKGIGLINESEHGGKENVKEWCSSRWGRTWWSNSSLWTTAKNYQAYLINGSEQDNRTIPDAKNVLILEGYDGLAGDRSFALEALQKNKQILKTISEIEQKIVLCVASGGGSTGSGNLPYICDILAANSERIVVPIVLMPRKDEPIQKRLNAYNLAKELMDTDGIGAIIFVNNESYDDLKRINVVLVNMLDAFFSDSSASSGSNFDDSEKMKMLKEPGAFVIAMLSDKRAEENKTTTQDMINALTAKNIFLPINNDGIVGNIGIINQKNNKLDEHELIKAIGTPENVFVGYNGNVNIACASGLSYPVEYIKKLGQSAVEEQKERIEKRKTISVLDDLNTEEIVIPEVKKKTTKGKRNRISLDFLNSL